MERAAGRRAVLDHRDHRRLPRPQHTEGPLACRCGRSRKRFPRRGRAARSRWSASRGAAARRRSCSRAPARRCTPATPGAGDAVQHAARVLEPLGVAVQQGGHDLARIAASARGRRQPRRSSRRAAARRRARTPAAPIVSELEIALQFLPHQRYIAITGTNGKTTTTALTTGCSRDSATMPSRRGTSARRWPKWHCASARRTGSRSRRRRSSFTTRRASRRRRACSPTCRPTISTGTRASRSTSATRRSCSGTPALARSPSPTPTIPRLAGDGRQACRASTSASRPRPAPPTATTIAPRTGWSCSARRSSRAPTSRCSAITTSPMRSPRRSP